MQGFAIRPSQMGDDNSLKDNLSSTVDGDISIKEISGVDGEGLCLLIPQHKASHDHPGSVSRSALAAHPAREIIMHQGCQPDLMSNVEAPLLQTTVRSSRMAGQLGFRR